MTVLIGYVPTPGGEAALTTGLAEAAAHGDDVVILNSPRRGSTVDTHLVGPDASAELLAAAATASRRDSTTPTTAPTSSTRSRLPSRTRAHASS